MPKIIKNGKEYSGVPIEVVTAWAPTADPVQVKEPLMGNTDISTIGDGTVTGAIDDLNTGLIKRATITGTTSSVGIFTTDYDFNRVIAALPLTGNNVYLAIRESASHKAVVFAYASSGGTLTSVNNTQITFDVIYV